MDLCAARLAYSLFETKHEMTFVFEIHPPNLVAHADMAPYFDIVNGKSPSKFQDLNLDESHTNFITWMKSLLVRDGMAVGCLCICPYGNWTTARALTESCSTSTPPNILLSKKGEGIMPCTYGASIKERYVTKKTKFIDTTANDKEHQVLELDWVSYST